MASTAVVPRRPGRASILQTPPREAAMGGALEGAERTKRETVKWRASRLSPDAAINTVKPEADARTLDMTVNDGYIQGAVNLQKDSIVGAQFRLNAKPEYRVIYGADNDAAQEYGEELAAVAEARFNLAAESEDCWFDAGGMLTFTDQVRLVVGSACITGEAFGTAEWQDSDVTRPFKTMIQMVAPSRVSNTDGVSDTRTLRRGIETDLRGQPLFCHIQQGYDGDPYNDMMSSQWNRVPFYKPWGRRQVLFIRDAMQIDQSRGVSQMVAALAHAKMTKKFSEVTLQRAVVDATYAAAIESELPSAEVITAMGGGMEGWQNALGTYMGMLGDYLGGSENIAIDGVKMPHFFPGTKLNMKSVSAPQGVGSDFEASLLRKIAASLNIGYSSLARDFSKGSYSSAKAEWALELLGMQVKKKAWADKWGAMVYRLWFEEQLAAGNLPLPPFRNRTDFYRPLMKDAYTRCAFIGTGRGQINELQETQAALNRIAGGLSTYEDECGRLGKDYREVFAQRSRENRLAQRLSIALQMPGTTSALNTSDEIDPQPAPALASQQQQEAA